VIAAQLAKGDEDGDDNCTVGELRADHPLDEINLKLLQIILGCEVRSIEVAQRLSDALGLLRRKSALLELGDQLLRIAYDQRLHIYQKYTAYNVNVKMERSPASSKACEIAAALHTVFGCP
jgi:hypothetical protein